MSIAGLFGLATQRRQRYDSRRRQAPTLATTVQIHSDSGAHPLIAPLNADQRQAVLQTDGPILVLAGAGSGKTRVITHKIAWLIEQCGVPAWQILAMTFTNKAAGEMRERVAATVGPRASDLWLGTFHSVGVRLLRQLAGFADMRPSFSIYDTDDQLKIIARSMKTLGISDNQFKPKQFASYIDRAKNRCQLPEDPLLKQQVDGTFDRLALQVYQNYDTEMRIADAVDFGDLIMRPVSILTENVNVCQQFAQRFRYVLVDEFQDTNFAQYELLKRLISVHGNLCVVGDDDQSIYSWRGAEVDNILAFPRAFPGATVVKLEQNYRSSGNILQASTAVVAKNADRHGKVLWTDRGAGEKLTLHVAQTERDEADWVARTIDRLKGETSLNQFAVFYRTNSLSRTLEESMRRFRLPYVLIGGQRFYERAEVKDVLAWCRLLINPVDSAGWLRAIVSPRRGIGQVSIDLVSSYATIRGISLPDACRLMLERGEAGKATEKLRDFTKLVNKLRDGIETMRADSAGKMVMDVSGIRDALKKEGTEEAADRLENLNELLSAMAEYADTAGDVTLRGFLEQVALVSDTDKLGDGTERVSMMTLHAAKGLEYDVTFLVGMEEGILPHANVIGGLGAQRGDHREVEEERRLLYVGMTRARKRLHLSHARMRRRFGGQEMPCDPSRFLSNIPPELIDVQGGSWASAANFGAMHRTQTTTSGSGSWANRGGSWGPDARSRDAAVWAQATRAGNGWVQPQNQAVEPTFDRSGDAAGFAKGMRVNHVTFGAGAVLEVDGYGEQARLTVQFAKVGVKKLIARFVQRA